MVPIQRNVRFGDARLPQRFWDKVFPQEDGCWLWSGARDIKGYGWFLHRVGESARAHRVIYSNLVGAIPDGLQIDHLCRVTSCLNPDHLEVVTARENTLRGETIATYNSKKVQCRHGHPFVLENTVIRKTRRGPARECRNCNNARKRERRALIRRTA